MVENITNITNITNVTTVILPPPIESLTIGGATLFVILWFIEFAIFEKEAWKNKTLLSILLLINITIAALSSISFYVVQFMARDPIIWIIFGFIASLVIWFSKKEILKSMK